MQTGTERLLRTVQITCLLGGFLGSPAAHALDWDIYLSGAMGRARHNLHAPVENRDSAETFTALGVRSDTEVRLRGNSDTNDIGTRIAGGTWFHPLFGIEIGYIDLGESSVNRDERRNTTISVAGPVSPFAPLPSVLSSRTRTHTTLDLDGLTMMAKARYPVLEWLDLGVSLGIVGWHAEGSVEVEQELVFSLFGGPAPASAPVTRIDERDLDLAFGLSLTGHLNDALSLSVEWTRYEVGSLDEDVDFVGATLEYHFSLAGAGVSPHRYAAGAVPTLARALAGLWPVNTAADRVPGHWEFFVSVGGGWTEHNTAGDSDAEFFRVEETSEPALAPFFPARTRTQTSIVSIQEDSAGWKTTAGVYVSRYFGLEAGYVNLGHTASRTSDTTVTRSEATPAGFLLTAPARTTRSTTFSTVSASLDGFLFNTKLRYPLHERLEFGVSLGAIIWDRDMHARFGQESPLVSNNVVTQVVVFDDVSEFDDEGIDLTYGVNLKGRLYNNLWLGFEWTKFEVGPNDRDVEFVGASLEYRFGGNAAAHHARLGRANSGINAAPGNPLAGMVDNR